MPHARTNTATLTRSALAPRIFALAAFLALGAFILVARAAQAQTPSPTVAPAGTPTGTATATPARRLELAPIESAEVQVLKSLPPQYQVMVTSGLPGGCAAFETITAKRDGARIDVTVMNSMPVGNVPCTAIYGYKNSTVNLGADFAAGTTYTVVVNEGGGRAVTKTFTTASVSTAPDTATPTPTAPPITRPGTVPLPANVGTGGVTAPGTSVEAMDAVIGGAALATAILALSVFALRVPRRRG